MKYSIEIDHKLKLIRYKQSGEIKAEEIGLAWNDFLKMPEFTQFKYNLLSDYSGGKFDIPSKKLEEIVDFMKNIEGIVRGKRQAIIIDDPYSTAVSILFQQDVYKEVGFEIEIFYSEIAAIKWLTELTIR